MMREPLSRTDVPALLAEIERLTAERDALVRLLDAEVMPRYTELYEAAGLGDPGDSVVVGLVYEALLPYRHVWDVRPSATPRPEGEP